jgi:hypothetical protein
MKNCASTDRAKPEAELRSMVARSDIFRGGAGNGKGSGIGGKRRKNAAGASLACEAMANASAQRVALDFDAKLSAATCSRFAWHGDLGRNS